ncbi:MAG: hypothetical protein NUV82_01495 [Candidatus Komeilibacteria bacterium]|nr:hypothetical protein [Candidatus Komeilibacteria bacterium]
MDWQQAMQDYGYPLYFLLLMVEGQPIYWLGGFLLSIGIFSFWPLLLGPLFVFAGDYLYYWAGYHYGRDWLDKYGKFILLNKRRVDKIMDGYLRHKKKMIVLTKFIYGFAHPGLFVYGLTKKKYGEIARWNLVANVTSYALYTLLGYYLGRGYEYISVMFRDLGWIIVVAIFLVILGLQFIIGRQTATKEISHDN